MRLIHFLFFTLASILNAATPSRLPTGNREPEEISKLDECIQLRFLDTKAFGMRRILPMQYHGVQVFRPENATEQAVVDQLQQKRIGVIFYLAGRNILEAPAAETSPFPFKILADPRRSGVQGPAFITPSRGGDFPQPETLLADSRRALTSFQRSGGYDLQKAGWTVAMRPLRASSEACVQCHTAGLGSSGYRAGSGSRLSIGDPLGVALYVYRQTIGGE